MKGYTGTILEVNLTTGQITKAPLDEALSRKFLGGAGYALAKIYNEITKETDPLGPDNILFFMTGPMTGTLATSTGRMAAVAKSPLTGILGECNSGSDVCVQLKKAGYDGILIRGASDSPKVLEILDDRVELKDASKVWGKGLYETTEILKKSEGFKRARVIAIGQAGENLVKFAIIGSEERAFGRTGLGAVMGSKKLKAIVIQGSTKIEVADPAGLKDLVKTVNKDLMEVFTSEMMQELGTGGGLDMYNVNGELPAKYYRAPEFEEFDNISGATLTETVFKKRRHCFACPIGCGRVVAVGENDLGLPKEEFEGPEYETLAGFGSLMMNGDMKMILKANYMCNDLGLDTISAAGNIALLMDMIDRGKISAADIDGIELSWGKMPEVFTLLEKISKREGIGAVIAKGPNGIIEKFGVDPEQVAAIKNSHLTYHDMRSSNGMSIAYGISPHYGGSHNACDMYMVGTGLEIPEMDVSVDSATENTPEMVNATSNLMNYRAFYSSAIVCVFANPAPSEIAKLLTTIIGDPFDLDRIKQLGETIFTLKRLFNMKMGHVPADEHIPDMLLVSLKESGNEGNVPDVDYLFKEFYKVQEWDAATGMPSDAKLERLGLTDYK